MLVVAPWTTFWDRNYFVESFPLLEAILTSHAVRGGVTGVGLLSLGVAVVDVVVTACRLLFWPSSDDEPIVVADPVPRT